MPRFTCKGSVTTAERQYLAGDEIELTDTQAAQLIDAGAVEAKGKPSGDGAKSESPKSSK